jgi:hypothetical protein
LPLEHHTTFLARQAGKIAGPYFFDTPGTVAKFKNYCLMKATSCGKIISESISVRFSAV